MNVFFALVITIVALGFVVYPVLKGRPRATELAGDEVSRELYSNRDTTYAALKELEFDYQSGVLSAEDYHELESRYKKRGVSILKDIDVLEKGPRTDDAIEAEVQQIRAADAPEPAAIEDEVAALRRSHRAAVDDDVESEIARLRASPREQLDGDIETQVRRIRQRRAQFCTRCGTRARSGDSFCGVCGAKLSQGGGR